MFRKVIEHFRLQLLNLHIQKIQTNMIKRVQNHHYVL